MSICFKLVQEVNRCLNENSIDYVLITEAEWSEHSEVH